MTNPVWPSAACPAGIEWHIAKAGVQFDAVSGPQAVSFVGERWEVSISLRGEGKEQVRSGLIESMLMHLAGGINQVDIWHWRRPVPRGTMRGSPTLQIASVRGDSQVVLTVSAGATLEPGDLIGIGGQVLMVYTACSAVGTTLTVPLVNRVRFASNIGTAVVWDKPLMAVVMPEQSAGLSYAPGQTLPAELQLIEWF